MTADDVARIRLLDVPWARERAKELIGRDLHAAFSERTGGWMTADDVALMTLHQLRTKFGKNGEARTSRQWLRRRGYEGLFGEPVA